jgi:hypothetical protein
LATKKKKKQREKEIPSLWEMLAGHQSKLIRGRNLQLDINSFPGSE